MRLAPRALSTLLAGLLLPLPVLAEQAAEDVVGLRVGTAGVELSYGHALNERLDLRLGFALGSFGYDIEEDGIDYDGEVRYGAGLAMLDYRPFGGAFRISAGAYSSAPEFALSETADNETYQLGNAEYTADGRFDGTLDFGGAAPYLGLGWGGATQAAGWGLSLDLGVMFADAPEADFRASGRACQVTLASCNPAGPTGFDVDDSSDARARAFQQELDNEARNVEEENEDLRHWPVVSLGLHYRF